MEGGAGGAQAGTSGLAPNVAAALSYVLGLITGIIFVILEKDNDYVRFHAFQSIIYSLAWIVVSIAWSILMTILGFILPVLGFIIELLGTLFLLVVGLGGFVLWIILIIKAYQGQRFKLPVIGDMAERYATGQAVA